MSEFDIDNLNNITVIVYSSCFVYDMKAAFRVSSPGLLLSTCFCLVGTAEVSTVLQFVCEYRIVSSQN